MFQQKLKKIGQNRYNKSNQNCKTINWQLDAQRFSFLPGMQNSNVPSKQIFGTINYKNIGILRSLINLEGKILSRRITRLASKKQRQIARAIKCSRVLGLLPFVHKTPPFKRKLRIRNFKNRSKNFTRLRRNTRRV